ncbi:hypothetical protein GPX89_29880 [Nocardia sp. ET3-3]|uniref:Uncharacterized protein n=1 Tax=Nocardia terrae TaxID=2675851 RepID=A0A7K1V5R2_9NOCA|nr:hypothetical protein [Nocardia terrae]MVU81438.1 hypothetical protein [Nocardia terrae]
MTGSENAENEGRPPSVSPDDVTQTPEPPSGGASEPTLARLIAEYGPMPEPTVRAVGTRLAEALAAIHALRQVFGDLRPETVLVYPEGPRLGNPRPSAQPATGPADDVYALAAVLVFAATGRPPRDGGWDALPFGLRMALGDCLSDDASRRPGAADLARSLAEAAPLVRDRVPPPPIPDSVTQRIPPGPTVPVAPGQPVAQPDSRSRLPWILAAACAVLIVAILATVGVVVATRGDSGKAGGGAEPTSGKAAPAVKYTAASIGDACALLDWPTLEKYIGKTINTPQGDKLEMPTVADSLECLPMSENGFAMLHIEVSDKMDMVHQLYDGHRSDGLGTTGSGVTTAKVPGIGEDAYQVIHEPNKGNTQEIGCTLGFLTSNVVAIVDVNLSEDNGTGRDKLAEICQTQAKVVLGRLK